MTVADARTYWETYYNEFQADQGLEEILAALQRIPPVQQWVDLGAGSESLLWSIPLRAEEALAVDSDPQRLALLQQATARRTLRPAYRTVLELCRRSEDDYAARCAALTTHTADCLTGHSLNLPVDGADLVTQFGLFGLTRTAEEFTACWRHAHALLRPGGWVAGANWVPAPGRHGAGRVALTRGLYAAAMDATGITPVLLTYVPITGDPDFTALWLYLGRTS